MAADLQIPDDVLSVIREVIDSGKAEVYLSGGAEKVEFASADLCAWYIDQREQIEKQIREQVAQEIETAKAPAPWALKIAPQTDAWIDSRDCTKAAAIARGER